MSARPAQGIAIGAAARLGLVLALALLASPASAQMLFWLDTQYGAPVLRRGDAQGKNAVTLPLPAGSLPEGLAVDGAGTVFFTEAAWADARVQRTTYAFPGLTPLVAGGSVLRGIAAHGPTRTIWWTTSNLGSGATIRRASSDGGGATTILTLPPGSNPRGIAVDPLEGKLYWTDFDRDEIWWSSLDGLDAEVWLSLPAGSAPYGIAVDAERQLVFWAEYGAGIVRRASTTGGGTTTIATASQPTYVALDLSTPRLYFVNSAVGAQKIRLATYDGTSVTSIAPVIAAYGGIAFASGTPTAVAGEPAPERFEIGRVWPNPGAGPIHVEFALPAAGPASVTIVDLQGREIAVLAEGAFPAGRHTEVWSGAMRGGPAPPGLYFARLRAGGRESVRRIVFAR